VYHVLQSITAFQVHFTKNTKTVVKGNYSNSFQTPVFAAVFKHF